MIEDNFADRLEQAIRRVMMLWKIWTPIGLHRSRFAFMLFFMSSFTCASAAEEDIATIVESIGQQEIQRKGAVGICIGVATPNEVLCVKAFGLANVEHQIPLTNESVFRIGSITKQFTAGAILLLAEDGVIALDDPLGKHLPNYPAHASAVTIQQLLQHTSGIQDFTKLPTYRRDRQIDASQLEVLNRFKDLPLEFPPGSKHAYCNSGYSLLGLIIEKASGQSYRDFVEARLFQPAKLKNTFCDSSIRIIPNRASGYSYWGGTLRNAPYVSLRQTIGAGNIASTAEDLLRWQQSLINNEILSEESMQLMMTKGTLPDGKEFNYGIGNVIQKRHSELVIRHGGGISGYRSDIAWYPESDYIISVIANSDSVRATSVSNQIIKKLLSINPKNE